MKRAWQAEGIAWQSILMEGILHSAHGGLSSVGPPGGQSGHSEPGGRGALGGRQAPDSSLGTQCLLQEDSTISLAVWSSLTAVWGVDCFRIGRGESEWLGVCWNIVKDNEILSERTEWYFEGRIYKNDLKNPGLRLPQNFIIFLFVMCCSQWSWSVCKITLLGHMIKIWYPWFSLVFSIAPCIMLHHDCFTKEEIETLRG